MGESGPVVVVPGVSRGDKVEVKSKFEERGMNMRKNMEVITPSYFSIVLEDRFGGEVLVEQSASEALPRPLFYCIPHLTIVIHKRPLQPQG
jgi:hypothetical protein